MNSFLPVLFQFFVTKLDSLNVRFLFTIFNGERTKKGKKGKKKKKMPHWASFLFSLMKFNLNERSCVLG